MVSMKLGKSSQLKKGDFPAMFGYWRVCMIIMVRRSRAIIILEARGKGAKTSWAKRDVY